MPRHLRGLVALALVLGGGACATPGIRSGSTADERVVITSEGWQLIGDLALPAAATPAPAPAVLLLNGAGRDRTAYIALARRLAAHGIASLRLDLRSMGESTNLGVFVPFDSTGHNDSLGFRRNWTDVRAALAWLAAQPGIDGTRLGAVGASFSGETLAQALREIGPGGPIAVAALSPGSFSDSSLARIDGDGRRWFFLYATPEMIVRRWQMDQWTRRGSRHARVELVRDSLHATDLLGSPQVVERLAEWLGRALDAEAADDRWARAADRVAAGIAPGWDDLRRPGEATASLGDGVAGRVRFLAAWHLARRSDASRAAVRRAADQLVALIPGSDSGNALYRGRSGVALALLDAADALEDRDLERRADVEIGRIVAAGRREGAGVRWSGANDVLTGDAGITAALRTIWRRRGDSGVRTVALAAGRSLVSRGQSDSGGMVWRWRDNAEWNLPNFSHGTAGIGAVVAMLSRELDAPPELLDAARGAARYLERIAVRDERGMRIPYGWPVPEGGWGRPFDANWAHGQAGTARLFWELWRATRDSLYLGAVEALVAGIDSAGILGTPARDYGTEPFGLDYRFGLTGIADLYADLYDATGDRRHLARALELAERVLSRADSGEALTWSGPRAGFMAYPGEPAAFTGLLHGAAGSGLLFLKLDALLHGRRPPDPLPDSPFGGW